MAARWDGPICGHPMAFYELGRERNDLFPVCHRPPHAEREQAEGRRIRHMSKAAVDHARAHWRDRRHRYERPGDWWPHS